MKSKINNKKNEVVWTCNYCGQEFGSKKLSDIHEFGCTKNPKNSRVLTIKLPSQTKLFWIAISVIFVYVLFFFLVNAFARDNNLEKRDILQPQKWFDDFVAVPTIVLLPTNPPTPTTTPSPVPKKKVTDSDPIVICESSSANCSGKSIEVRNSQCSKTVCCQVGNNWTVYATMDKCREAQDNGHRSQNQNSNVNCWQKRSDGSYVYNFGTIPKSECDSQVKALSDSLSHFRDPVTGTTLVDCNFKSSDYSFDFGRITSDQCKAKSDAFWKEKNDAIKNRPTIGTQNPAPTSMPSQKTKAQCQSEIKAKYDALQSQYGGGSALESINQNYNAEMNACNQYP